MWTMTNKAFLSAVAHRDKEGVLMVRARNQEHLDVLCDWLHAHGVRASIRVELPSDYPYRLEVSQVLYATWTYEQVMAIDYHNFKGSVKDKVYHDALMRVWGAMQVLTPLSMKRRNDAEYDKKYPSYRSWWRGRTGGRELIIPAAGELDPEWDDDPTDDADEESRLSRWEMGLDVTGEEAEDDDERDELYGSIHDLSDEQVARLL